MKKNKCPYSFDELFALLEEEHRKRRAWQRLAYMEALDREKCLRVPLDTLYEFYLEIIADVN